MRRELRGMVVVITGASAGIGKALAEALAPRGARLVLAARRAERLEELNRALGGGHLCVPTDVADRAACEALIRRTIDAFGRLDTLVCNAGYGILRPVAESSPAEVEHLFRTNLYGTADCVRAAVPIMASQDPAGAVGAGRWRGQMIIVSSAAARRGLPYFGVYSATKAAQLSLAEAMRVELRPQRIAVTSVHPIGTETEFTEAYQRAGGSTDRITQNTGEVRQTAEDVARAMVRAIERPTPECWPFRPSRWMLSLATLAPGWVDRVMAKRVVKEQPEPTR